MAKHKVSQGYIRGGIVPSINYLSEIKEVVADFSLNYGLTKNARRINAVHEEFTASLKDLTDTFLTEKYKEEKDGKEVDMVRVPSDKLDEFNKLYEEISLEMVEIDFHEIAIEKLDLINANINIEAVKALKGLIIIDKEEEAFIKEQAAKEAESKEDDVADMEVVND